MSDTRIIPRPEIRIARDTAEVPLRLKGHQAHRLVSTRRVAWHLAGLAISIFLFMTRGGTQLYAPVYDGISKAQRYLIDAPGAPLSFLNTTESLDSRFQLQGIVYSAVNPIAVVNTTTLGTGERASVRVGKTKELVQCLEIRPESVELKTSEGSAVLHLE